MRLKEAMVGVSQAELARNLGVSTSLVNDWRRGSIPSGATIFAVGEALDVDPRWLATGEDWRAQSPRHGGDDWVVLPRYDLYDFTGPEKPVPIEDVPVRRDWLAGLTRATTELWLTDMPSNAMPEVGREGDSLVCQNTRLPLVEGGAYAFLLHGRPLVRRLSGFRPNGLVLKADAPDIDPLELEGDEAEAVIPLGRVLAAMSLKPV